MKLPATSRAIASLALLAALAVPIVAVAQSKSSSSKPAAKPTTPAQKPAPWTPPKPAAAPSSANDVTKHPKFKGWVNETPDTGQFLADSVWLARVGPRTSTVGDFINRWFAAYPPDRPGADSAGRVQFLSSMVDRDVLALTAKALGKPLGFEDRHALREAQQSALVTAVFKYYVTDSVSVSEAEAKALYETYKWDQHVRHILLLDEPTAAKVRRELTSGKLAWNAAVSKYSLAKSTKDGDLGWLKRDQLPAELANPIYALKPGEYSQPLKDAAGWHIILSVERRPRQVAPYEGMRRRMMAELENAERAVYMENLSAMLRKQEQLAFDSANCVIASQKFRVAVSFEREGLGTTMNVNEDVPEFAPEDTGRVLATWRNGGRFTIDQLVHAYHEITPLMRPALNTPDMIMFFVEGNVLQPAVAEYGAKKGLENDPGVKALVDKKVEELMVGHLFQDSVARFIWVSKDDRRAYYQKHLAQFHTYAKVDFAAISRHSQAGADSVVQALKSGKTARAILAADSAAGRGVTGSVQQRSQAEEGAPYQSALFNEMRVGDIQVRGPDREGVYVIIQSLAFDPGRQLSYEESESMIDESLQNIRTEQALRAFIDRWKPKYAVAWRPERVALIKLVDPTLQR